MIDRLLDASPQVIDGLAGLLGGHRARIEARVRDLVSEPKPAPRLLHAAAVLARLTPDDVPDVLDVEVTRAIVEQLVASIRGDAARFAPLTELLWSVRGETLDALTEVYRDHGRPPSDRAVAASLIARYASDDRERLVTGIMEADPEHFPLFMDPLRSRTEAARRLLGDAWKQLAGGGFGDGMDASRHANVEIALLRLGDDLAALQSLESSRDPDRRAYLIARMPPCGVDPGWIVGQLERSASIPVRRSLLLTLGGYDAMTLDGVRERVVAALSASLSSVDAGERSAADWAARELGVDPSAPGVDGDDANWTRGPEGLTLSVVRGPTVYLRGSPDGERSRNPDEPRGPVAVEHSFAISLTEVTVEQFLRCVPDFEHGELWRSPDPSCPVLGVTWHEAARFCNWLSERDGIPEAEWCYAADDSRGPPAMHAVDDVATRRGYRLPLEVEWELAARAGTDTSRYFGDGATLITRYAWCHLNGGGAGVAGRHPAPERPRPLRHARQRHGVVPRRLSAVRRGGA